MRAAVEDLTSKTVGSASQFLEVPEVGRGRLALSGVLLKGVAESETPQTHVEPNPDAPTGLVDGVLLEPEVRVLSPGVNAVYAYEIYDGLKDDNPELQMAAAVIRDGKVVYQSPFTPVTATPKVRRQDAGDSHCRHIGTRSRHAGRPVHARGHRPRTRMPRSSNGSSGSTSRFDADAACDSASGCSACCSSRASRSRRSISSEPPDWASLPRIYRTSSPSMRS